MESIWENLRSYANVPEAVYGSPAFQPRANGVDQSHCKLVKVVGDGVPCSKGPEGDGSAHRILFVLQSSMSICKMKNYSN